MKITQIIVEITQHGINPIVMTLAQQYDKLTSILGNFTKKGKSA
jgi:hypothetical protein